MLRTLLSITALSLTLAAPAHAAGEISVLRTVPYASDSIGTPAIRKECQWNTEISDLVVKNSGGKVVVVDALPASGKVLDIKITQVHAPGGGGWSGPKWGRVEAVLTENGKVVGNLDARRTTTVGGRTCGQLSRIAGALGKDVASWLENPTTGAVVAQ